MNFINIVIFIILLLRNWVKANGDEDKCTVKNANGDLIKKYTLVDRQVAWKESLKYCEQKGTLAIVSNDEEADVLWKCLRDDYIPQTWIGLKWAPYVKLDGIRWGDCSSWDIFQNSAYVNKMAAGKGECGMIRETGNNTIEISYEQCSGIWNFVCQENVQVDEEYQEECFQTTTEEPEPTPPPVPTMPPAFNVLPPLQNYQNKLDAELEAVVEKKMFIWSQTIPDKQQSQVSGNGGIIAAITCDVEETFSSVCDERGSEGFLQVGKEESIFCGSSSNVFANETICVGLAHIPIKNQEMLSKKLPKDSEYKETLLLPEDSNLISISFFQRNVSKPIPIEDVGFTTSISIKHIEKRYETEVKVSRAKIKKLEPKCGFMNGNIIAFDGCDEVSWNISSGDVNCRCKHTTMFAVLLSVNAEEVSWEVQITSYVFEMISVIFLLTTLIILLVFRRRIRSDRTPVQINLVLALLFHHVVVLFQTLALKNDIACVVVAVLIHFTILAAVLWMLIEGVFLLLKTAKGLTWTGDRHKHKILAFFMFIGWGIPVLVVGTTLLICYVFDVAEYMYKNPFYGVIEDSSDSKKYHFCWVGAKNGVRLFSVVIPVALVLATSIVIASKVMHFVYVLDVNTKNMQPGNPQQKFFTKLTHYRAILKAVLLLIPIMGIPWILGFFANIDDEVASVTFQFFHVIVNGLQGFFLFLIYCVIGSEVRTVVSLTVTRITSNFSHISEANEYKRKKSSGSQGTNVILDPYASPNRRKSSELTLSNGHVI